MLSKTQIEQYNEIGAIVVPDILSADEVQRLRGVTDEFVERARGVTAHNEIYDLEDSHAPDDPRVRRIKAPHLHHPEYARLVRHPNRRSAVLAVTHRERQQELRGNAFLAQRDTGPEVALLASGRCAYGCRNRGAARGDACVAHQPGPS